MTPLPSHSPPRSPQSSAACPRCGGSGILRLGDQRYRTCLDCLGQGQILTGPVEDLVFRAIRPPAAAPGTVPASVPSPVAAVVRASASVA